MSSGLGFTWVATKQSADLFVVLAFKPFVASTCLAHRGRGLFLNSVSTTKSPRWVTPVALHRWVQAEQPAWKACAYAHLAASIWVRPWVPRNTSSMLNPLRENTIIMMMYRSFSRLQSHPNDDRHWELLFPPEHSAKANMGPKCKVNRCLADQCQVYSRIAKNGCLDIPRREQLFRSVSRRAHMRTPEFPTRKSAQFHDV